MFFDMHTDILHDIVRKRLNNEKEIIKKYHIRQLLKGNFYGGIWTYYTDVTKPLCSLEQATDFILEELECISECINVVKSPNDFNDKKINVILGFESLQPVKNLDQLKDMYNLGFRHAMLTWNEENHFATGVLGSEDRGLTDLGKEVIKFMNENKMIIDISHANLQTFNDIINISNSPVIASHSNIYNLCDHKRNLQDYQINKVAQSGGVISLTAVKNFVNPEKPTIENFIKHIEYLINMNLTDHIAIGFDFMNYLNDNQINSNLVDLPSAEYTYNLYKELIRRNFSDEVLDKITHKNALHVIKSII